MRKKSSTFNFVLIVALMLFTTSCATTNISTVYESDLSQRDFSRVMVAVPFQDLDLRKTSEAMFVEHLTSIGINAVRAIDFLPPIKEYTGEEIVDVLQKNSISATMVVSLTDSYSKQSYIPSSSTTTGSARVYGNTVYGRAQTSTSGGYYVSKPRVKFEVVMIPSATGNIAWKATTLTQGNAFANDTVLMDSLSAKVITEFASDIGLY